MDLAEIQGLERIFARVYARNYFVFQVIPDLYTLSYNASIGMNREAKIFRVFLN